MIDYKFHLEKMIAFLYHQQLSDGYPAVSPSFCLTVDHKMLDPASKKSGLPEPFEARLELGCPGNQEAMGKSI